MHIGDDAIRGQLEDGWQIYFYSRERGTLQVAPEDAFQLHRIVRPAVLHRLWQCIAHKEEEVGTTQGSLHLGHQLSWHFLVEGIQIHIYGSLQVGNRRAKCHIQQLHLQRIHHKAASKLVYLQAALLFQFGFLYLDVKLGITEIEGICLQSHVGDGKMVEIHSRNRAHVILIVVHPAVLPVQMSYLVETFIQVEIGGASQRITHVSIHLEGISRHV